MKTFKLSLGIILVAALGFVSFPTIMAGQTGGETPTCDEICTDLCGEPTLEDCQYTYCDNEDPKPGEEGGEGEYMCKGEWQG